MNVQNGIESLPQISTAQTSATPTPVRSGRSPESEPSGNDSTADKAHLSAVATQAAHTAQSASNSEVRLDKVAAIQNALQAGTYRVPASDVAQKVIASLLVPEK